jgi:hypothetical protein
MRSRLILLILALTATMLTSSAAIAAPPSRNLAQSLADTKAMLATGHTADIVVLGDSLSFRSGSYLPYFRSHMQAQYGDAGGGYQGFSVWTGAGFNAGWLPIPAINFDIPPYHSLDGLWNEFGGTAPFPNTAHFYPSNRKVRLQYLRQPGGGAFQVHRGFGGQVVATIDTNIALPTPESDPRRFAPTLGTFDYELKSGETAYTIQPIVDGRRVTILGQNNIGDAPGVRIHRAANGGWGVNNFLSRDRNSFDFQLADLSADLVMVWIGQNDQAYDRHNYAAKIDQLVTRLQLAAPQAELVLVGTYDQGAPALAGLVEGMHDVAVSRGVGFINLYATAGNAAFFNANGYLDDGVHFSPAGGAYMGQFLFNAFLTDGASLPARGVPEPTGAAMACGIGLAISVAVRPTRILPKRR